jgi:hypothetical protein
MEKSCIFPYVMDNVWSCMDSNMSSLYVIYLKCDKGRESRKEVLLLLCILLFFYKLKILSTLYSNFGQECKSKP